MAVVHKKIPAFHTACGAGDLDTVLLYLSGGKVDMIGGKRVMVFHLAPGGTSALSMAATGGHIAVMEALLGVKAPEGSRSDINGTSNSGDSPLLAAAAAGQPAAVSLLLSRGADVSCTNELGETAMHCAARHRDSKTRAEVMSLLSKAGLDSDAVNKKGQTAARITEEIDASGEILLADGGASGDGAAEQQSASDPVKGAIEKTYVDTLGRRMKKVLSLEDATWDEFGRRVLTGTEAFDGKESSKERKLRRQAAKERRRTEEEEALYIAETGDDVGYQGFTKVGDRVLTDQEKVMSALEEMGYHSDTAEAASKRFPLSLEKAVEWADAHPRAPTPDAPLVTSSSAAPAAAAAAPAAVAAPAAAAPALAAAPKPVQAAAATFKFPSPATLPPPAEPSAAAVFLMSALAPSPEEATDGTEAIPAIHVSPPGRDSLPSVLPQYTPVVLPGAPGLSMMSAPSYMPMVPGGPSVAIPAPPGAARPGTVLSTASASAAGKSLLSMVNPAAAAASPPVLAGTKSQGAFATDTQISQTGYKERELQAFDASGMVDTDTSGTNDHFEPQTRKAGSAANLEGLDSEVGGWDQFKANEREFGATTTYSDEFYTTALDKSKISAAQREKAEKIASEIMRSGGGATADLDDGTQEDDAWASDVHRT